MGQDFDDKSDVQIVQDQLTAISDQLAEIIELLRQNTPPQIRELNERIKYAIRNPGSS